ADSSTLKNYVQTATYNEGIDGVSQSLTRVEGKVDGLQVGGRNYLRNSKERVIKPRNAGTESDNYNFVSLNYPTVDGQIYTLSVDVEITDGTFNQISVYVNYGNTSPSNHSVPIEDGKITRTYVAHDTMDNNGVLLYAGLS